MDMVTFLFPVYLRQRHQTKLASRVSYDGELWRQRQTPTSVYKVGR